MNVREMLQSIPSDEAIAVSGLQIDVFLPEGVEGNEAELERLCAVCGGGWDPEEELAAIVEACRDDSPLEVIRFAAAIEERDAKVRETLLEQVNEIWLDQVSSFRARRAGLEKRVEEWVNVEEPELRSVFESMPEELGGLTVPDGRPRSLEGVEEIEEAVNALRKLSDEVEAAVDLAESALRENRRELFDLGGEAWERLATMITEEAVGEQRKWAEDRFLELPSLVLEGAEEQLRALRDGEALDERDVDPDRVLTSRHEEMLEGGGHEYKDDPVELSARAETLVRRMSPIRELRGPSDVPRLRAEAQRIENLHKRGAFWLKRAVGARSKRLERVALGEGLLAESEFELRRKRFGSAKKYGRDALGSLIYRGNPLAPEAVARSVVIILAARTWPQFKGLGYAKGHGELSDWLEDYGTMFRQIQRGGLVDEVAQEWASIGRLDVAEQFFETVETYWAERAQLHRSSAAVLLQIGRFTSQPSLALGKLRWLLREVPVSGDFRATLQKLAEEVPALKEPGAGGRIENEVRKLGEELVLELEEMEPDERNGTVITILDELPGVLEALTGATEAEEPHLTVQLLVDTLYPEETKEEIRLPVLVRNKKGAAPAEEVRIQLGIEAVGESFPSIEIDPVELEVGHLGPGEHEEMSFFAFFPDSLVQEYTECRFRIVVHHQDDVTKTTRGVKIQPLRGDRRSRALNNPFSSGEAVTGTEFVGREAIMERLHEPLASRTHERPVVLYGIRRIGKTSILRQVKQQLEHDGQHHCVYFTAEDRPESDVTTDFLIALSRKIRDTFPEVKKHAVEFDRDDFRQDPYAAFEAFVGSLDKIRGSQRMLLILDEFDALLHLADLAEEKRESTGEIHGPGEVFQPRTFGALRGAIMERDYFNIAFAGMPSIKETEYEDRLFGLMIPIEVGPFSKEEAKEVVERGNDVFKLNPMARKRLFAATGLQPYLLQLVCHELYPKMANSGRDIVTRRDVDDVIRFEMLENEEQFLDYIDLIGDDYELLLGLAAALEQVAGRKQYVSDQEVHQALVDRGLEWTLKDVKSELARLRDEGSDEERPLIESAGRGINRNRYRFVIGMLGEFLLQRGI